MPNWNYNEVTIDAPEVEVRQYFVNSEKQLWFNMSKIFPDIFPDSDPTGEEIRIPNWASDHTGSKWFPIIHDISVNDENSTFVDYETAWAPNNLTLLELSEITGWKIKNIYEEPGMSFEGTFICKA